MRIRMRPASLPICQRKRISPAQRRVGGWRVSKGRCCRFHWCFFVSSGDPKVFLLSRCQAQLHLCSMSGLHADRHAFSGDPATEDQEDRNNPVEFNPSPQVQETHLHPQAHGSEVQPRTVDDWQAGRGSLDSSSSEDSCKEKFEEKMSLDSLNSGARTPLCRICFQGPEQGEMLSPCRCSGSVRCTHEPCLIKWISERGSWSCELCYYKYHVISISTKNPLQWQAISLTVIEKVQMAAAVLGSLFLVASISWLVWSSLSPNARWQRQDLLFQICYTMYGFMDLVCIVLIVHEGPSVFRILHRWQAVNQRWKVLNYDKARDVEEQQKPDATPGRLPHPSESSARAGPPSLDRLAAGETPSPSTSFLLAAVAAAQAATSATSGAAAVVGHEEEEEEDWEEDFETSPTTTGTTSQSASGDSAAGPSPPPDPRRGYRWTYSVLHLLGQRQLVVEQRAPPAAGVRSLGPRDTNRELVMRVTSL